MAINLAHRLVYFVPEAAEEYAELGVKGQPGYFASRAAPMGAVPAEVVIATFYNFSPLAVTSAFADRLAERCRVLAFDLPGHGAAPAPARPEDGRLTRLADALTAIAPLYALALFALALLYPFVADGGGGASVAKFLLVLAAVVLAVDGEAARGQGAGSASMSCSDSTLTCGSTRWSQPGRYQFALPKIVISEGMKMSLTMNASSSTGSK